MNARATSAIFGRAAGRAGVLLAAVALLAGCGSDEAAPDASPSEAPATRSPPAQAPIEPIETPVGETPPPASSASEPSEPAASAPADVAGHYRVAGIDGQAFDAPYGIALYFSGSRIEFENCQQIAWSYSYSGGRITIERTPAITIDIRPKPAPCAAPLPPPTRAMVAAIDAAQRVARTPENGLRLSGGGHSITLFSQ